MPRAPKTTPPGEPPLYDPAQHRDPDEQVYLELYCACGSIRRQIDPVRLVRATLADWLPQHQGDGHGPASKADAVAEREARREAAHRAAGRAGGYERGDYPHLDDTCTQPRPWPALEED